MLAERSLATAFVLALLATLVGCAWQEDAPAVSSIGGAADDGYRGAFLGHGGGDGLRSVPLTDTEGRPLDLASESTRSLVVFGSSRCTMACPMVLSTLARALDRLPAADRQRVQVVFVSTDPADRSADLRRLLDRFDPAMRGAVGSPEDVAAVADALGVRLEDGRSTATVSVVDGHTDLAWTNATPPTDVASDVRQILQEDR